MTTQPVPIRSNGDLSEVVAEEVRALMGRHRVSQIQLAEVLHVSQGQVSARLRGKTPFTLDDLRRLSDYFNTTPAALLGLSTPMAPPPTPPAIVQQRDELAALTAKKRGRGAPTREYSDAA